MSGRNARLLSPLEPRSESPSRSPSRSRSPSGARGQASPSLRGESPYRAAVSATSTSTLLSAGAATPRSRKRSSVVPARSHFTARRSEDLSGLAPPGDFAPASLPASAVRQQTLSWAYRELRLARRSDPLLDSSDPDGRGLSPTSLLTEQVLLRSPPQPAQPPSASSPPLPEIRRGRRHRQHRPPQLAQLPAAGPALSSGDLSASLAFGVDGDGANMDTGAGDDTEDPPSSDYDGAESPSTKSWFSADNVRDIALTGIKSIPAVCLAVILNLLDAMSYGIIIFPASDTHVPESAAQSGISMFLASSVISQVILTCGGSAFRGVVGSMMIEVVPFLHIICATIEAEMTGAHSHAITATIMVAYAMSTIMTGVVFLLLGIFKLGNLIQFFPRHILVGCIGGIGLFLLFTGIEVTADVKPALSLDYIWAIFEPAALRLWGSSLSVALLLKMIQQFVAHPLLVPAFYLAVPAAFYAIVLALGISLDTLRHERWLFDLPSASETPFWTYFTYIDMSAVDWRAVFATIPTQLALTFFGILHVPINVPALAVSTKQDVDLSWEIVGHGLTNVAAGLMFSPQNYLVYSNSLLYVRSGGDSRVSGVLLALATAALWIKGGAVIGFVPTIVVGSLIFHLGIDLLLESVVHTWFVGMHPLEYATILLIVGIMGGIGFTEGVVAGIVLACVFFVVMYSRRSIIRDSFSGSQLRSTVHRLYRQQIFLDNCGDQIQVIKLQGFMFFGTVNQLGAYIQDVFVAHPATKFVLLDFSLINGIDYSALESFQRTKRLISNHNSHLVFCGLGPLYNDVVKSGVFDAADDDDVESDQDGRISRGDFEDALPANVHSFATLNEALEWCENVLLETFYTKSQRTLGGAPAAVPIPDNGGLAIPAPSPFSSATPRMRRAEQIASFVLQEHPPADPARRRELARPVSVLLQAFSEISSLETLLADLCGSNFELVEARRGESLFNVGDPATELFVIEEGELVMAIPGRESALGEAAGGERVVETLLPGTMVGELEMFSERPRMCRLYATQDALLWKLSRDAFDALCHDHPALMITFVTKIALSFDSVRFYNVLRHWGQLR